MKKYSFLLSAFAQAQNKYADWTYPTDAQIEKSLGSIDKASLNQNEDFEMRTFDHIANVVVGSHWTEFSNEYGSCATDIGTSTEADKRHNPRHPDECFSERCSDAMKRSMRYRVCVLPDHPDVVGRTGSTNFMTKLVTYKDSKLNRFTENKELEGIISNVNGNYTTAYKDMMARDFTDWVPAHGFPRELQQNECGASIIDKMNAETDSFGDAYKNTDQTFCEYDANIGAFVGCSNQLYHSVNPRCDPKMYFLGVALLDANDQTIDLDDESAKTRLSDNTYQEKLSEVLDELERAHYLEDGKYTFSGVEKQITGTKADGAIVTESYLVQVDVDKQCPQPDCPIPQPWTEWTCHCDVANANVANANNIPLCCNDKRRRFRGCERGCNSMKCSEAKTKLDTLGQCPSNEVGCGISSAWTSDSWFTADNILTESTITEADAVNLILNSYLTSNTDESLKNLYGFTEDDVKAFLTADSYHKNIDIAEIRKYVELNCLNADNGNNNLIAEFDRCFADKNTDSIQNFHESLYPKPASNLGDYYDVRGGPIISVNVADKVDSIKYTDSAYYKHGAQNIYSEYPKLTADRVGENVYTDSCLRAGTAGSEEVVVQCDVELDTGKNGKLGYSNDKRQRNNWVLNGGVLSLPSDHNTRGIVGALVDWFESFECPNEMAWEEEACPARPSIVPTQDDTCVVSYQETEPAKCAEGFVRDTLVVQIEWGGKQLKMYWNQDLDQFGDPTADNFHADDFQDDGTGTFAPTQDYLDRKKDLKDAGITAVALDCDSDACELCANRPVPCKNPCEYTTWSEWGSWAITSNTADSQTAFDQDNLAPAGGSGWFNGRDDCGEVLAQGQCFRVFENAAAVANVKKFIDEAVSVLADAAKTDEEKIFALSFIHSWVKDGAFVADSDTFVTDAETAIAANDATAASALATVTFTAKYEVLTDEGFHLDVIKQWFNSATTNMAPHGWRFSCRNRNSNVKGYKARHRDPDCAASVTNPDCCGLVDLEECDLPICPDWTAWSEFSECSSDCQASGIGHGYKIQGRNCEADTNTLMSSFVSNNGPPEITGERVVIQLPEAQYIGCSCDTPLADETMDQCQTTSFIASTADQCRWKLATCNTDRLCPTQSTEIMQACPACGTGKAHQITKISCVDSGERKADWEDIELTPAHCGIDNELIVTDCVLTSCNGVSISSDCVDGSRSKIENGEIVQESCGTGGPTVWSDWTECPASCAGRPAGAQFRFSAQSETETRACPASTDLCPTWSAFGEWSECVDGKHSRSRTCENATNGGGKVGSECAGDSTETCGC